MKIIEETYNWRGRFTSRSRTDYIALHHAEAVSCTAQDVHRWHLSNGWAGIGYHFFVRKDGSIYRGRPLWALGAHVQGMNDRSIGICAEGDYHNKDKVMPEAQKKAIKELLKHLKGIYPDAEIVGHREIGDSNCPGRYYPLEEMKNYESEENDMTTHEDLQNKIEELERRLEKLETPMIYNYIDKNMPEWAHEAVQWCVDKGIVKGVGDGKLGLDDNKLWQCVTLYRFAQHIGNALNMKL